MKPRDRNTFDGREGRTHSSIPRRRAVGSSVLALLVVLTAALLGLGTSTAKAPDEKMSPFFDNTQKADEARKQGKDEEAERLTFAAVGTDYRMLDFVLVGQEQVDFLLTPALLVQEAVSDDVVLTYPAE